jgi:glycine/D-amino acid oxidase-like deaminating enzyme
MDLHSDDLYWPLHHPAPHFPPLADSIDCEVAIVGGGVSGALVADALTGAGIRSVVLLDQNDIATGSIAASTALLQYELDCGLLDLIKLVGRANAERCYQLCNGAIDRFADLATELGGCGFVRRRSLFLDPGEITLAELDAEAAARRAIGIDVRCLDRAALRQAYGFDATGALLSEKAAEVNPLVLTHRLIERSVARGLRVFTRTAVDAFETTRDGPILRTNGNHAVRAKHVVYATGYAVQSMLKLPTVSFKTTFVAASEPVSDFHAWRDRCLIWEARTPYFYARTTADNRILIGGEDEDTIDPARRDALLPAKTETLVRKFSRRFPEIDFRVAHAWAGVFAESDDSMPYIGPHPAYPGAQFILGCGGNGITFALLAADLVRDAILGKDSPDAQLYAFGRRDRG